MNKTVRLVIALVSVAAIAVVTHPAMAPYLPAMVPQMIAVALGAVLHRMDAEPKQ